MTDEPRDLAVENALLRSCLWQTARRLKDYRDAPHFEIEDDDDIPDMEVIVPASLREKAAEALEKAQAMLKGEGEDGSQAAKLACSCKAALRVQFDRLLREFS